VLISVKIDEWVLEWQRVEFLVFPFTFTVALTNPHTTVGMCDVPLASPIASDALYMEVYK